MMKKKTGSGSSYKRTKTMGAKAGAKASSRKTYGKGKPPANRNKGTKIAMAPKKMARGAVGPRGKNMKKSYGR